MPDVIVLGLILVAILAAWMYLLRGRGTRPAEWLFVLATGLGFINLVLGLCYPLLKLLQGGPHVLTHLLYFGFVIYWVYWPLILLPSLILIGVAGWVARVDLRTTALGAAPALIGGGLLWAAYLALGGQLPD